MELKNIPKSSLGRPSEGGVKLLDCTESSTTTYRKKKRDFNREREGGKRRGREGRQRRTRGGDGTGIGSEGGGQKVTRILEVTFK